MSADATGTLDDTLKLVALLPRFGSLTFAPPVVSETVLLIVPAASAVMFSTIPGALVRRERRTGCIGARAGEIERPRLREREQSAAGGGGVTQTHPLPTAEFSVMFAGIWSITVSVPKRNSARR